METIIHISHVDSDFWWNINQRRLADDFEPIAIIDLTESSEVEALESAAESAPSRASTYKCPICISKLKSPVATDCGHVYCSACLYSEVINSDACPLCNKEIDVVIRLFMNY